LRRAFVPVLTETQWQRKVRERVQGPGEPGTHYTLSKVRLLERRSVAIGEAEMIPYLVRGLTSVEQRSAMLTQMPETVGGFIARIQQLERVTQHGFEEEERSTYYRPARRDPVDTSRSERSELNQMDPFERSGCGNPGPLASTKMELMLRELIDAKKNLASSTPAVVQRPAFEPSEVDLVRQQLENLMGIRQGGISPSPLPAFPLQQALRHGPSEVELLRQQMEKGQQELMEKMQMEASKRQQELMELIQGRNTSGTTSNPPRSTSPGFRQPYGTQRPSVSFGPPGLNQRTDEFQSRPPRRPIADVQCFECQLFGHFARDCPRRQEGVPSYQPPPGRYSPRPAPQYGQPRYTNQYDDSRRTSYAGTATQDADQQPENGPAGPRGQVRQ
jgi:hypothetical protein